MSEPGWRRLTVGSGQLEILVRGSGEPVLLVQTALVADELLPLAELLTDRYRVVTWHRRGYAGSSRTVGPASVRGDAADGAALLSALGLDRAHVVGVSFSGTVAMELAAARPDLVHTLCLVEPPPLHVAAAEEFRAANAELLGLYRRQGAAPTVEAFMVRLLGPAWREVMEEHLPGAVAAIERDAETFFADDIPALLAWRFGREDAARIHQPVLYVGGTDSGPWFAQVRELIAEWFPQADRVPVPGADHNLVLTHTTQVATALRAFLAGHRLQA